MSYGEVTVYQQAVSSLGQGQSFLWSELRGHNDLVPLQEVLKSGSQRSTVTFMTPQPPVDTEGSTASVILTSNNLTFKSCDNPSNKRW